MCYQLLLRHSRKIVGLILFSLSFQVSSSAQEKLTISGTVRDEMGTPLVGVTVHIKNKTQGTITNGQGEFHLSASPSDSLVFSYVGYQPQTVAVDHQTSMNVNLKGSIGSFNEVVVVGYGQQTKSNLASSISQINASQFKNTLVNSVTQAIQGRVAGVQIVRTSGEPGADVVFRIRGNNSLSADNQPLIVIDGIPQPTYYEAGVANLYGSVTHDGTFGIDPNDIASIEILKDASATAIYGSRGANGVVYITTKSGEKGLSRIQFTDKTTYSKISRPSNFQMMDSKQYAEVRNEYDIINGNPPEFNPDTITTYTDWFKAITRSPISQDYYLGFSGGGAKTTYYASVDYLIDQGVIIGSDNRKGNLHLSMRNDINNWYSNKIFLDFSRQFTNRAISTSRGFPSEDGPILDALRATPYFPLDYHGVDGGGRGITQTPFNNPYLDLTKKTDILKNDYSNLNLENDFYITKFLTLQCNLGSTNVTSRRQVFFPSDVEDGNQTNGKATSGYSITYTINGNAYLTFIKKIAEKHSLNATFGAEYYEETLEQLGTYAAGFDIQLFGVNNIGSALQQSVSSYKQKRVIESQFIRLIYTFNDKYIFNGTIRRDGASPFAENKKFGYFPSAGVGYYISKEPFMRDISFINNLKIRASYGVTGSQSIGPYQSLNNFGSTFYQIGVPSVTVTSLFPTSLGNSDLTWESTKQLDIGIDFSGFDSRFGITLDYYNKVTDHLLQSRSLPSQSGFTSIISNYGKIGNRGLEAHISIDVAKSKDFDFTTSFNFTKNINKLISLGDRKDTQYIGLGGNLQGGVATALIPGRRLGYFFGYKVIGLVQASDFKNGSPDYPYFGLSSAQIPGMWKYMDLNGDGKIDMNDRMILGNSQPKFIIGWSNTFNYKRFTLDILFTGSFGNKVVDLTRFYVNNGIIDYADILFNQTKMWFNNRYTSQRPTNNVLYPGLQKSEGVPPDINSTMVEDGSYFRMKNITLSYTIPKLRNFVHDIVVFFTGTNVFTITRYRGFDPEVSSYGQSVLQQGIDYGAYPYSRSYTLGVNCNF